MNLSPFITSLLVYTVDTVEMYPNRTELRNLFLSNEYLKNVYFNCSVKVTPSFEMLLKLLISQVSIWFYNPNDF